MARISVIIVPFVVSISDLQIIKNCIQSLALNESEHSLDFIAIVNFFNLDDGYLKNLEEVFDHLEINDQNILARAWNRGIDLGFQRGADYCLIINPNVIFHKDYIQNLVEFAKAAKESILWSGIEWKDLSNFAAAEIKNDKYPGVSFSSFLLDQRLFDQVGRFDENFIPAYFEDSDMAYRIQVLGLTTLSTARALFYHIGRSTIDSLIRNKITTIEDVSANIDRCRKRYLRKWGGDAGCERYRSPFNQQFDSAEIQELNILMLNHYHLASEFRNLGHEVFTVGLANPPKNIPWDAVVNSSFISIDEILEALPAWFKPTHILYHDNSHPPHIYGLETCKIPTIFYAVDTHIHTIWQKMFGLGFDQVMIAQRDHVHLFTEIGCNAEWLPLWAANELSNHQIRDIDVCFRGSFNPDVHPARIEFFRSLSELIPGDYGEGPYSEAYARSKIVINQVHNNDVNFRVFEALMSGALLITPKIENGINELFIEGQDFISYENGNVRDAYEKIYYFLKNDKERLEIAERGRRKVMEKHSAQVRAEQLCLKISKISSTQSISKLIGLSHLYCDFFQVYYRLNSDVSLSYLTQSLILIQKYAEGLGNDNEIFSITALKLLYYLECLGEIEVYPALFKNLSALYPDNQLLKLYNIRKLLLEGLEQEALSESKKLSDDHELILDSARKIFDSFSKLE